MLGWFIFPLPAQGTSLLQIPFGRMLWERRGLDVIAQIVLIFSGVMGLIGLLSETKAPKTKPAVLDKLAAEIAETAALVEAESFDRTRGRTCYRGSANKPAEPF